VWTDITQNAKGFVWQNQHDDRRFGVDHVDIGTVLAQVFDRDRVGEEYGIQHSTV
jgi:hypothetical protein